MRKPRVLTISPTTPFLPTLAHALLDGALVPSFAPRHDPLALAGATVYLPTRRAARALGEALLDALGGDAALLPRIVPLGEPDEDALAFADLEPAGAQPRPIAPTERRLVLAQLVLRFAQAGARDGPPVATTPAAALLLADELARLFDDLTIAEISFDALDEAGFVPPDMDEYWQRSLAFVRIARAGWDAHLAEKNLIDPIVRRDLLLGREAERIRRDGGPVIAAGSTGTIPSVARLIAAIAREPQGAVVLPGLDTMLDDDSFALIDGGSRENVEIDASPGHPQFGLKRLLGRLGIARTDVAALGSPALPGREALVSEAFRPASTTERWHDRAADFEREATRAFEHVAVVEAGEAREEALALAIALRKAIEEHASAALVTPDRPLARRVAAELRRWEIDVDDSAGTALADTEAGRLARLAAGAAAEALAPVPLLALLRHPLVEAESARATDALEVAVLRGPRPAPGADGLARAIEDAHALASAKKLHRRDPRARLTDAEWAGAERAARRIGDAVAPLLQLADAGPVPFAQMLAAHRDALDRLGLDLAVRQSPDVRALEIAFEQFTAAATDAGPLTLAEYGDVFAQLLAVEPPVRPPFDGRARVRILGPLEARLLQCDRVLIGGLNEGAWPPETHVDAWLNRPMRRQLKLDLPERRVGLAAHDFVQAMGAREVILSRARKQNGVETVASRFLQRLQAVAPADAWDAARTRGRGIVALAQAFEPTGDPKPIERPRPTPPAAVRPTRLSVTEIETLIRDPYSIYARHVLRLYPLDPIDADPGAAERGIIVHEALAEFVRAHPTRLPADALEQLLACGRRAFGRIRDFPGLEAVWWPRFERVARWLVGVERERRGAIAEIFAETSGSLELDAGGRPFRIGARADRVERLAGGAAVIIDYKTGEMPTLKQAIVGLAPQLPLEAAIAKAGGFETMPDANGVADILVIKPSGGDPPGDIRSLDPALATGDAKTLADARGIATCDDLADYARRQAQALLTAFANERTPYHSIPRPKWRARFGDYDHLARIKEWSANDWSIEE